MENFENLMPQGTWIFLTKHLTKNPQYFSVPF